MHTHCRLSGVLYIESKYRIYIYIYIYIHLYMGQGLGLDTLYNIIIIMRLFLSGEA